MDCLEGGLSKIDKRPEFEAGVACDTSLELRALSNSGTAANTCGGLEQGATTGEGATDPLESAKTAFGAFDTIGGADGAFAALNLSQTGGCGE